MIELVSQLIASEHTAYNEVHLARGRIVAAIALGSPLVSAISLESAPTSASCLAILIFALPVLIWKSRFLFRVLWMHFIPMPECRLSKPGEMGHQIEVPSQIACCGQPAFNTAYRAEFLAHF